MITDEKKGLEQTLPRGLIGTKSENRGALLFSGPKLISDLTAMASEGLPALPPRSVVELPKLPPRAVTSGNGAAGGSQSGGHVDLPPLPSRASVSPSSNSSATELDQHGALPSKEDACLPPLPQRHVIGDVSHKIAQSEPITPEPTSSTTAPASAPAKTLNAFVSHGSVPQAMHTAPQPALPPRGTSPTPSATTASNLPPLPSRSPQPGGVPSHTLAPKAATQPPLPNRRTQSAAPPMNVTASGPPPLPAPIPIQDTSGPVATQSSLVAENRAVFAGNRSPSPNSASRPSSGPGPAPSLPQRASVSQSSAPPPLPPSQPHNHGNLTSPSISTPSPSPPLATPSQVSNQGQYAPRSQSVSANGPPPAVPRSISPTPNAKLSNSAPAQPPRPQSMHPSVNNMNSGNQGPPTLDRSTQPPIKVSNANSAHSSSVVSPSGSSGLYLGSNVGPAPTLPPSRGPAPALPPSRGLPPPRLTVTPSSPNTTRNRSRSFDASAPQGATVSGAPNTSERTDLSRNAAPAIPARSSTPNGPRYATYSTNMFDNSSSNSAASNGYAKSSSSSSSSISGSKRDTRSLSPGSATGSSVAAAVEESGKKPKGRSRANSADGFAEIVRDLTSDNVAEGQYSVMVLSPQKQAKVLGEKEYVMMYPIEVKKGHQTWTVFRRYKQFYTLDNDLKRHHLFKKANIAPAIPPKNSSISKKDPLLLEARRRGFQQYLSQICQANSVADSDTFYMFIQPLQIGDTKPK